MAEALGSNLLSPIILSFALGVFAGLARSDLTIPESVGKAIAVYLMFAIGLKGGLAAAGSSFTPTLVLTFAAGLVLSFGLPLLAYFLLRTIVGIPRLDAAAISAHYGSISVVTFVTGAEILQGSGVSYEGYLVAVLALMETPAIMTGMWLARRKSTGRGDGFDRDLMREVFLNGSVVLLVGGFVIGWITGPAGMAKVLPFFKVPFSGVLCLFLLDMGLLAARRLSNAEGMGLRLVAFGFAMPLIGGTIGVLLGTGAGLSVGGATLLGVLAGSASYIAVPAAMRLAIPEANPALSLTLALAITFPFNVVAGIPLYWTGAAWLGG